MRAAAHSGPKTASQSPSALSVSLLVTLGHMGFSTTAMQMGSSADAWPPAPKLLPRRIAVSLSVELAFGHWRSYVVTMTRGSGRGGPFALSRDRRASGTLRLVTLTLLLDKEM